MLAVATWGAGRVIAMPDHQWLNLGTFGSDSDTATFYQNGITWLAEDASKTIKVVTYNNTASASWLTAQGFTNVVNATEASLAADLVGTDVFVAGWLGNNASQAVIDTTRSYVTAGWITICC